jgi:hypothetical protein
MHAAPSDAILAALELAGAIDRLGDVVMRPTDPHRLALWQAYRSLLSAQTLLTRIAEGGDAPVATPYFWRP